MYLSRVEIDFNDRRKMKELSHLGAFHNWVEQSFPGEIATGQRNRHLWRIDPLNNKRYLLVLSDTKPDITHLAEYGVADTAMIKSYDSFLDKIQADQTMRFRLTANPTHAVPQPDNKRSRIAPYLNIDQQRQWLLSRSDKLGFQIDQADFDFDVVSKDWPQLQRKGGQGIRLLRVTYEGILQVKDPDIFKQMLIKGVGREKAFGMGLMTVIPVG